MNTMTSIWISCLLLLHVAGIKPGGELWQSVAKPATIFMTEKGGVRFTSDAPLELIEAESYQLRGLLDTEARTFAFTIDMLSFEGFNSPLQREHFNEIYMETEKFPKSTFAGKIIEEIDFQQPGTYTIRTKGKLKIHGVEQERIIRCDLTISPDGLAVRAQFPILLSEYDITIPRVFHQKIAEEIQVDVSATFQPQGGS